MRVEAVRGLDKPRIGAYIPRKEKAKWRAKWRILKFAEDWRKHAATLQEALAKGIKPIEVLEFEGNVLLNEGINEIWQLVIGGSANHFDNANSQIGVGDGTTAEDASQTDLVGTNTAYKGMDSGYPSVSGQTVTFQATFGDAEANFAWEEITVRHASTLINLNRKQQSMGTKASGTTSIQSD